MVEAQDGTGSDRLTPETSKLPDLFLYSLNVPAFSLLS